MQQIVVSILIPLLLLVVLPPNDGQENQVIFYKSKPDFEPAKLEIDGYVQLPSSNGPAVITEGQGIKLSLLGTEDDSSSEHPAIQQRFLGFHRLWPQVHAGGYNQLAYKGVRRTQTVLETVTRTTVAAPLCLLCTCTLGINVFGAGSCGNVANGFPIEPQPAICGSGPSVVAIPTLCPSRIFRRDASNLTIGDDDSDIRASPVLSMVPSVRLVGVPGYHSSDIELQSSKDDTHLIEGRKIFIKEEHHDHGFDVVITRRYTTITTVRGSLTAQVQVGGLNCLPDYLQGVPRCTRVGQ